MGRATPARTPLHLLITLGVIWYHQHPNTPTSTLSESPKRTGSRMFEDKMYEAARRPYSLSSSMPAEWAHMVDSPTRGPKTANKDPEETLGHIGYLSYNPGAPDEILFRIDAGDDEVTYSTRLDQTPAVSITFRRGEGTPISIRCRLARSTIDVTITWFPLATEDTCNDVARRAVAFAAMLYLMSVEADTNHLHQQRNMSIEVPAKYVPTGPKGDIIVDWRRAATVLFCCDSGVTPEVVRTAEAPISLLYEGGCGDLADIIDDSISEMATVAKNDLKGLSQFEGDRPWRMRTLTKAGTQCVTNRDRWNLRSLWPAATRMHMDPYLQWMITNAPDGIYNQITEDLTLHWLKFPFHVIPSSERTALVLTYHAASAALTGAMMAAEEVSERLGDTSSTPHPVRGWDDRASWVYSSDGRLITTSQAVSRLLTYLGVPEVAIQPLLSSPAAVCETLCAIIQDTMRPGGEAENRG